MSDFSDKEIIAIWNKGRIVNDSQKNRYRQDQCGAWIELSKYGNTNSQYGWEIDHINPVSKGGSDNLSNLRPLHWENNRATSNGRLTCPIKAK